MRYEMTENTTKEIRYLEDSKMEGLSAKDNQDQ